MRRISFKPFSVKQDGAVKRPILFFAAVLKKAACSSKK
jgi:hypothetical protein